MGDDHQPGLWGADGLQDFGFGSPLQDGVNTAEEDEPLVRTPVRGAARRSAMQRGAVAGVSVAHDRAIYCDTCDLGYQGSVWHCEAEQMLQHKSVSDVVEAHEKSLTTDKGKREDPDRRQARYAMYRGIVQWKWADPLGAGNRVRLPKCMNIKVRRLFANPCCDERGGGCDMWLGCEQRGHYTGFRTAEESRAIREGTWMGCDAADDTGAWDPPA
jgi:hypothetical protein